MTEKKYYSTIDYVKAGEGAVAVLIEARVAKSGVKVREAAGKKVADIQLGVQNRTATVKSMVKALGGDENIITPNLSNGNEYVSIRCTGWEKTAERMEKSIHPGDVVRVFGTATVSDKYLNMTIRDYWIARPAQAKGTAYVQPAVADAAPAAAPAPAPKAAPAAPAAPAKEAEAIPGDDIDLDKLFPDL